jgi:hypothetical protein
MTQLSRDSANAARIAGRVERVALSSKGKNPGPRPGKKTRKRALWERDPRCFWCGRETNIKTANAPDSASLEHLYSRGGSLRGSPLFTCKP